ncbi:MAG: hypothetical protein CSA44_01900 [Gammaproteobacteria bacterium]|nr:MAG: hypothetical protein CSA44_01900 [Gammaproteobacteria bacterium]
MSIMRSITCIVLLMLSGCITSFDGRTPPKPKPKAAAKAYFQLGVNYMAKGRYDLAEIKLQKSIAIHSTAEAYNALAVLYEELHDNTLAEQIYQELLTRFPDYGRGYLNYLFFLCQYDRRSQIDTVLTEAAGKGREIAAISHIAAGNCALKNGDENEAKHQYQRALDYEQYAAGALLPLAEMHWKDKQFIKAKSQVDLVNNQIGYSARSLYLATLIERSLGHQQQARKMYQELIKRFPNSQEAKKLSGKKE